MISARSPGWRAALVELAAVVSATAVAVVVVARVADTPRVALLFTDGDSMLPALFMKSVAAGQPLLIVGTASSAQASCTNAVDVGFTIRSGSQVKGQGSWTKCDGTVNRVMVQLWESSWDGGPYTNVVVDDHNPANFGSWIDNVAKVCTGSGKRQWFVEVSAWNTAGAKTTEKQSNIVTTTC